MRVLVCGSRDYPRQDYVGEEILALWVCYDDLEIIHGACPDSPDEWAGEACEEWDIPCRRYPARWQELGRRAGFMRNLEMLDSKPDLVLAFWDGKSKGTKHTMDEAKRRGIQVKVVRA